MGFVRRLTAERKLISTHCPELSKYDDDSLAEYLKTLDITKLGDITDLAAVHTIFTVTPLTTENEKFVDLPYTINHWEVFRRHVTSIENMENADGTQFKFAWDAGKLKEEHRADLPIEVVQDVARMIVSLANNDGIKKPHTARVGFTDDLRYWRILSATNAKRAGAKHNS